MLRDPNAVGAGYVSRDRALRLGLREARIGDRLNFARHLDHLTLETRDGLLVQVIRIDGFPFETAPDEELNYRKQVRETLLRSAANSRLALYHHIVRRRVDVDLGTEPADPVCRALNRAWSAQLGRRKMFVNDLYLTLVRRPLQGKAGFAERLLRGVGGRSMASSEDLRGLHALRERIIAALSPYGARALEVYERDGAAFSEPCAFLASLLYGDMRPVLTPAGDIGQALATRRLTFGPDAIEIGTPGAPDSQFAAMVSLKDYPARSAPGMLDMVMRLPHALILSESFAFVDRQSSLERIGVAMRRLRAAEDEAYSLRDELASARDGVGAGRSAYGEHHLTILVKADSLSELDTAVADVQSAMTDVGAIAVREDINLEPAYWAQFPGNFQYIARKALISVANFSSFASLHNFATGQPHGNHWGEAVTVLETTAHGRYYFNFHNGDLGNFTMIGPSGSGKTVLLTFLLSQATKFNPRLVYFDKDRGAEIFIRALRGRYEALRPGEPTGLNPLQMPDTPANRSFLIDWIEQLVGMGLSSEDRALVADAVDANFDQPVQHRRLRFLREMFLGGRRPRSGDIATRLQIWCDEGQNAWLFDNEHDSLDLDTDTLGVDMTRLLDTPAVRTPAMMYLFHRVEQKLDGRPTIIVVDEGWKALDDDVFVARIKDWEKTIRKRNGIVGFCTQSASDALESRISATIIEQSATQIFLPNPKAKAAEYMEGFGLSRHEFELVRTLPDTSHCFLIKQPGHSAVARLNMDGMPRFLTLLAGTERTVRRLDLLRAEYGDDPAQWLKRLVSPDGARR